MIFFLLVIFTPEVSNPWKHSICHAIEKNPFDTVSLSKPSNTLTCAAWETELTNSQSELDSDQDMIHIIDDMFESESETDSFDQEEKVAEVED